MRGKHAKAFTNRRQHAQGQTIDLQNAQRVDVVLVPFDEGAVGHGAVFEGDDFAQRRLGDHEAADVLGQVPRKTEQLPDQADHHLHRTVARVEAGGAQGFVGHGVMAPPVQRLGQHVHAVEREAERFADVAHRGTRTIRDDFGGDRGPLAAVLLVDVLKDLLAPLVLEVDIDVRGLVAFATDEPLEEQVDAGRIDRGHAEAVAHGGVRRRAASLAEYAAGAREADQIPDRQEVVLVFQLGDER